ncbi:MAG: DegV family protein [Erysipelotrichaceae bacterium]|nr:DegV family protein [Erysipelotrichaceae bacterium]
MLVLFTDTDTDLTPEEAIYYGYKMISMPYIVKGKEIKPYVDFKTFDSHSFYNSLREGLLPTTCALNSEEYKKYFEEEFKKGNDILYVHFSKAMTCTFDSMNIALEELKTMYPERKFYTIDTKAITIASLNIVKEVGDMYKQGKTIEEILSWAETEVDHFAQYFYADNLKFFKRSGRVSNIAGVMGDLIGIKPIIHMSSEGKMVNVAKVKGRIKALQAIISYMEELGDDIENHRIIIGHTDALELANKLEEMIIDKFGNNLKIEYAVVNPTAGSHCGPDGVGVSFHAKHR